MNFIRTYFIGGFATDERLFRHQLETIPNAVYLPFPKPEKSDTLESYALKFIPLIDQGRPFNLVGQSMGGLIVMELIKHIRAEKIILISSVKCRAEMPAKFNLLRKSGLYRLVPGLLLVKGIELGTLFLPELIRHKGLRRICLEMTHHNGAAFLQWCARAVVLWEGTPSQRTDIIHIQGTKDKMFPVKQLNNIIPVTGGSHLMLLSRAEEMTHILMKHLFPGVHPPVAAISI